MDIKRNTYRYYIFELLAVPSSALTHGLIEGHQGLTKVRVKYECGQILGKSVAIGGKWRCKVSIAYSVYAYRRIYVILYPN